MEEMNNIPNNNPEGGDTLPDTSLAEEAPLIERAQEINSGAEPRKSIRQRLGSMAARRSVRRYEGSSNEQPHLVEQAIIAEQGRFLR